MHLRGTKAKAWLGAALLALAACGASGSGADAGCPTGCARPADCPSAVCCFRATPLGQTLGCRSSPDDCGPIQNPTDVFEARVCLTDADCVTGGLDAGGWTHCCPRSSYACGKLCGSTACP